MTPTKRMRPSPAMLVAIVALVTALGGSAVAGVVTKALTKDETKQVKSIAKKQANKQIGKKESSLSVARAKRADRFGGMTAERIAGFSLGDGESQELGPFGPFTLTATCTINQANTDTALVTISTDQSNSAFKGEDEDSDFDAGDTPSYVEASIVPTGTPDFQEDGGAAIAPDGTQLLGHQLYAGVNVLGDAGTCRFGGVVFVG